MVNYLKERKWYQNQKSMKRQVKCQPDLSSSLLFPISFSPGGPWTKAGSLQHCTASPRTLSCHCITILRDTSHLQSLPRSEAQKEWPGAPRVRIPTLGLGFTFCNLECRTPGHDITSTHNIFADFYTSFLLLGVNQSGHKRVSNRQGKCSNMAPVTPTSHKGLGSWGHRTGSLGLAASCPTLAPATLYTLTKNSSNHSRSIEIIPRWLSAAFLRNLLQHVTTLHWPTLGAVCPHSVTPGNSSTTDTLHGFRHSFRNSPITYTVSRELTLILLWVC